MDANTIYCGDNLDVLPKYIPGASVDLIYIDPPFNSSRNYEVFWGEAQERRSFDDRFGDAMAYIEWMRPRLRELHRVLKPTGTFYYHCDWHASHYVKVELDRLFGFNNFRNEIIWRYRKYQKAEMGAFARNHDTILMYAKDANAKFTFNPQTVALDKPRRYLKRQWDKATGRIVNAKDDAGRVEYMTVERQKVDDVWDLPYLMPASRERLGYPTQKPLALLERIIAASSNPGDVVLDAFCGCGTTLEAAAKLKRRWVGIDYSPTACRVMGDRLEARLGFVEGQDFHIWDMPKSEGELRTMPPFEFQNWAVIALGGIPNRVKVNDYGIDGRLYAADIRKEKSTARDLFGEIDNWYPIQVKQKDKAGRPDIDSFETAMQRDKRLKGYFVAFDFTRDAFVEIKRANTQAGIDIVPVTVKELLAHERAVGV